MANSLDEFFRLMREAEGCEVQTNSRLEFHREGRKGVPEVILAEGKQPDDTVNIVRLFLKATGRALVSRVSDEMLSRLGAEFPDCQFDVFPASRMAVMRNPGMERPTGGGKIGVLTAGTSDVPVAEEARVIAEEMGCEVLAAFDVGVAGIHRLFQPLRAMLEAPIDALVVAAGMDGALPSVVAGLVDVPVIGLPTSVGYGLGGKGVAALMGMLQSCAPGLVVVNIDNGIGAGATAALIANRMAAIRRQAEAARSDQNEGQNDAADAGIATGTAEGVTL